MAAVTCGVGGCGRRLQPLLKVDPRDRDTWLYPECEACGRAACDDHSSRDGGRVVCDRCRQRLEERNRPVLQLGLKLRSGADGPAASTTSEQ